MSNGQAQVDYRALLKRSLAAIDELQAKVDLLEREKSEPIAIVGMGCRFPGGANDPQAFWQLLRDGVDTVTEVPPERWDVDAYYHPDPDEPGKSYTRWGAFLKDIDLFDPQFFGISPREAISMDPQQRLLLEVSWEALEHAGQAPLKLNGTRTGVYVGMTTNDYAHMQVKWQNPAQIDAYFGSGVSHSIAAGRLSYTLGLQGPAVTVDTACSSSLVAAHLAVQSLRVGECDLALAGGVNLSLMPEGVITTSRSRMMSFDGRCKTFDASADGYVRGEGCGVIVLKRMADALADGDRILAVIQGSALNQDGRSNGLTAPSGPAQEAVIRAALANANIEPGAVSYIEAHGTGTSLGDPIEIRSLSQTYGDSHTSARPLMVGSVKTNVGHLEAAAGVVGIIKVVLALQNRIIPPHLHLHTPNPYIPWDSIPITVPTRPTTWQVPDNEQLVAGISSFGFSGTNAHMIIAEAPPEDGDASPTVGDERPLHLLSLSAQSESALYELVVRYEAHLAGEQAALLAETAYTANTGRSHFNERLAITAADNEDALHKLVAWRKGQKPDGVQRGTSGSDQPEIVFLFTGQGAQYAGMGKELYDSQPVFRAALDECAALLAPHLARPLLQVIFDDPAALDDTAFTQPALFALEYALAQLWLAWGIRPAAVLGHSVGEFVAACVAGVLTLPDALTLIATRGRLMSALPRNGAMAAVFASPERVEAALAPFADSVAIAALNGPQHVVISGEASAVQAVVDALAAAGVAARPLAVSHAFHSPLMDPMLDELQRAAAGVTFHPPRLELISNLSGRPASAGELSDPAYWRDHARRPVQFAEGMRTLHEAGYEVFLELGPAPVLLGMGRRCLPDAAGLWLPSLRRGRDEWATLLDSLAQLYVRGAEVDWEAFDSPFPRRRVPLPTYPFQRQRFWIETHKGRGSRRMGDWRATDERGSHPLLGEKMPSALRDNQYESIIGLHAPKFLAQRRVLGRVTLPEMSYLEIGLAAAADLWPERTHQLSAWQVIESPELADDSPLVIQTIASRSGADGADCRIFGRTDESETWRLLAEGHLEALDTVSTHDVSALEELRDRLQPVDASDPATQWREQGLEYGESWQLIRQLWRAEDGSEALAELQVPAEVRPYRLHPMLLEMCARLLSNDLNAFTVESMTRLEMTGQADGAIWCHARVVSSTAEAVLGNLRLFDETGRLVAYIDGLQLASATPMPEAAEWLYQVDWHFQSLDVLDETAGRSETAHWLILGDGGGVGCALSNRLEAQGHSCRVVEVESLAEGDGNLDLDDPATFRALIEDNMSGDWPLRGIVHLWALDAPEPEAVGLAAFDEIQKVGHGAVLRLIQALANIEADRHIDPAFVAPRLWLVTRNAQPVTENPKIRVEQAPLWGLGKTIALEHPRLWGSMIDLDACDSEEIDMLRADLQQALTALKGSANGETEIAYRQGRRYVARLVHSDELPAQPGLLLRTDGAYLITGGLGGLGLLVARWLAEQGARRLILLGRAALPPRREWRNLAGERQAAQVAAIRRLEEIGVSVHTAAVDISDETQLAAFLLAYEAEGWPPIRGLIHAAGIVEDRSLSQLTPAALNEVARPKVRGGWLLHRLLGDAPLDFCVYFSSAASLLGSPGQANYAAANAFMDALAHYRRGRGQPAISINWAGWEKIGMANRSGVEARWERLGVAGIPARQGLDLLGRLLAQPFPQAGVLPLAPDQLRQLYPDDFPLLKGLAPGEPAMAAVETPEGITLMAAAPAERPALMLAYLRRQVGRVIQMDVGRVDAGLNVMEIGLDSIMIMELIKEMERDLRLVLYPREIFEQPSLSSLATYLVGEMERSMGAIAIDDPATGDARSMTNGSFQTYAQPARLASGKRNPAAIFLLSSPRSGSTLLRVMLAGHPALFCPPELHLLPFDGMGDRENQLVNSYLGEGLQRAIMELKEVGPDESQALLMEWVAEDLPIQEVYSRLQEMAGARVLVDKSPVYASDITILERAETLFENAKYIHLVRHPYAVIDSFVRHRMDKMLDKAASDPLKLAEQVWTASNSNTLDFLEAVDPERHHLVLYEDLVTDPEGVMRRLCAFLGIPFMPELLTPYQGQRMTDGVHAQSRSIGDPDFLKYKTIDAGMADAWRKVSLPRRLGGLTRRVAEAFGYNLPWPVEPVPPQPERSGSGLLPIEPVTRTDDLALSFPQFRLLFLDQFEPGLATYNIPAAVQLRGTLNEGALQLALGEIMRRHEALRTNFVMREGQPYQIISPAAPFDLPLVSLDHLPQAERVSKMRQLAGLEVAHPFDLSRDIKLRASLIRLDEREHVLVITMHHIASDGWSIGVFLRELATLYEAFIAGNPSPLPELPVQYADFAQWQRKWLQGERLEKQMAYWRQQLGRDLTVLELPTDRPRPAMQSYKGRRYALTLSPPLAASLKALSRREGVTLYMTLLAAFQTLLFRYTGQEDIAVGSPISGRDRPEIKELIGFFVNTLVMRADLSGEPTFRELLARVRQVTLAAYEHQDVPFEKLVEAFWPSRNMSHSPLFQVMFILQNAPLSALTLPDLMVTPVEVDTGTSKFDLNLSLTDTADGLHGWLEYNTDLFDQITIERMVDHFRRLLESIVADPGQAIADLPLMSEAERRRVVVEWNDTARPYPQDGLIQQMFEAQAHNTPDAVAVIFEGTQLTYAELNQRANQLAHYLQTLGVGPEVIVGVFMERSLEMVIAVYGILKAGGAYVPLEPTLPADRVAYMLADTQAPVLLTQAAIADRLPQTDATVVCLDSDWAVVASSPATTPLCPATPANLAYVIYTSGSTGKPKGVMNEHGGVMNRLLWGQEKYPLAPEDRHMQKTPFGFDVSVPELFWPMMVGASLVIARPEGHRDMAYLEQLIDREKVTVIHFVPSMLQQFVEVVAPGCCPSLRRVFCTGEVLSLELQGRFFEKFDIELHNLYGPTEAAVEVSYWQCLKNSPLRTVPIGRPMANTQLYVLDKKMQPVPVGVAGELHIGGSNVARGYLNRPELTAEKFVPDPFTGKPGARLYKTGDLARFLPDGNIEYLGRIDFQVKVRGFRIELGEIETILGQHEAVKEAVVVLREAIPGDQRLVAYLTIVTATPPTVTELRQFLKQKLPDYMIPTAFVFLAALPLTASGKTNRKALPEPDSLRPELASEFIAPRTPLEKRLAAMWAKLLHVEKVGLNDNFFELGGHSLLAAQLNSVIEQDLGVSLPLRTLFESSTVMDLALHIARNQSETVEARDSAQSQTHTEEISTKNKQEELKQNIEMLLGGFYE